MKFICLNPECKKTFLYTAKQFSSETPNDPSATCDNTMTFETHVCPYCHGLDFEEYVEPVIQDKIVSLLSVPIEEVDALLKEGYEVREVYAKNAILQKKAEL